ncbi:MAG: hypothetical protein JWN00_1940 [Actinomycetia bacterium]|nr:hypothetical protein [Actinomycetes bacterium]
MHGTLRPGTDSSAERPSSGHLPWPGRWNASRSDTFSFTLRIGTFCSNLTDVSAPTAPGWFPDPYGGAGMLRWWDGAAWTQTTRPSGGPPGFQPPVNTPYAAAPYGGAQAAQPFSGYGGPATGPYHGQRRRVVPWVLGCGGVIVVLAVAAVAAVYVLGRGATAKPTARAPGQAISPVVGRVSDTTVGLSYARLGPPWLEAGSDWLRPGYFSAGQVSIVQAPFGDYSSFNATSLSGTPRPVEVAGYSGAQGLSGVAQKITARIVHEHFNLRETRKDLGNAARTVAGRPAWLTRFRLSFGDAASGGWKFTADTVAVLVIDLDGRQLGFLWVSLPDTFPAQGDLDQVLSSVRVP